ncbi:MAG: Calx-beta domain-containing protein [Candidatus Neomarinimicrobiota bacterium]
MYKISPIKTFLIFTLFFYGNLFAAVEANFLASTAAGDEDADPSITIYFTNTASGAPEAAFGTLDYTVLGTGTATQQGDNYPDFNFNSDDVTLSGETEISLNLGVYNDDRYELDETIVIRLESVTSANFTIGSTNVQTFTITDDETGSKPEVTLSTSNYAGAEGIGTTITISREEGSQFGLSGVVNWAISNGSTVDADHSSATSGSVTFTQGSNNRTFTYTSDDDAVDENFETFTITITTGNANVSIGSINTATFSIEDDDDPPTVGFSTTAITYGESQGSVTITAMLSAASGIPSTSVAVSIDDASTTNSNDHDLTNTQTINYVAGSQTSTETVSFDITQDVLDEPDTETLIVNLSSPNGLALDPDASQIVITITDDDAEPTVFVSSTATGLESVANPDVTVSLSAASGRNVSVLYGSSGGTATGNDNAGTDDYQNFTGQSLTISAGTTSNTFSFNVNNDLLDEDDETIIYAISSPTNAALGVATQTYTIQDDDAEPSFGFAAATSVVDETEVDLNHVVIAQLNVVSGKDVTFDYVVAGVSATGGGTDFLLADGSGSISAGAANYNFTANIEGDALYEGNETFTITLSNISNASDGTLVHTVTIADNETTPTIGFSTDATNGQEATTSKSFTIQLNAVSGVDATVSYAATGGTATGGGTDYTLADGSVTIAANLDPPQATFDLAITDDVIDEIEETVIVTLSSPGNATLGTTQLTYTINDDDAAPSLAFTSSTFSDDEDNTNGQFNIALSGASGKDITYGYTINTGTTTASAEGVDYTLTDGVGTITAGNTTANINFTVNDDALDEENEILVVTLDTDQFVNALLIGTPLEATYTITDNDNPPNIQFTDATSGMTEVDGTKNIEVSIASVSGKEVSVTVSDNLTGNATVNSDYTVNSQSYTIAAGQTTVNVPVNIPGDEADEDESAETVVLGLSGATNSTIVGNDTHTLTITDSDPEPTIIFTNATADIQENIGNYTIDFNIDYKSYQDVSFDYSVANTSTAVGSGTDYTLANGTATISAGSLTGTITLPINNDNLFENTETIVIDMGNPTNCSIGATPTTTISITDNDNAPTVRFAVGADAAASDATSDQESISVTLSTISGKETTIPYTIGGASTVTSTGIYADHNLVAGNLVIPIGSLTGNITYNPVVDNTYENDEILIIDLGVPTNATLNADGSVTTHSVTFSSSDAAPTIGFSATTSNITETDEDAETNLEIQLSARSEVGMSVYASGAVGTAESGDFSVNSGTAITIDASTADVNNLTANVPVTVVGDLIDEENQTFTVTLSSATDANISVGVSDVHTVTIVDNDAPPVVRIYYQGDDEVQAFDVAEGNGSFTFKVALAGATEKDVSIDYEVDALVSTTKLNQDYSGFASSGTFTLSAGVSSQDVTVTLTSDIVDEPNQTLKVDLVSGTETNATLSGTQNTITGTILDDDLPPYIYFNNSNSTQGNEGAAGVTDQVLLTVTMTDTSEQVVIIPYSLGEGTATTDVDFILTDHSIADGTAITISPGSGLTSTTIQLDIVGDNSLEENQTVIVNLDAENVDGSDPYRLHPTFSTAHTYTIINDDTEPDVEFASATYTFDEDVEGATVTTNEITVTLSAASEVDATIDYAASDGTAVGADYTVTAGTLTISAGEVSNTFTLSTLVDNIDEENETFTITLSNPDNASLGSQSTTTVTITDNDNPPSIFIGTLAQLADPGTAINKLVDEDVGATNFQVTLSTLSQKAISIDYTIDLTNSTAKDGQDYNSLASSGTINLAAGETSTTVDFNILSDLVSEDAQTIIIELDPLSAVNATADGEMYTGTMTIGDDDPAPKVYFNAGSPTSANEGANGNTSTKTFQVTLSDTSEKIITIPFTVAGVANTNIAGVTWNAGPTAGGQDYTSNATSLTINPLLSLSSADIDITIIGDDIDEYNEVFTITLDTDGLNNAQLHPSNATAWTYTITDDDDPPSASISAGAASAEENAPDATITLNTASEKSTSFTVTTNDGTATLSADEGADGGDYFITTSSVLALAPGVTEGVIDISGVDDVMYEGNETFSVTVAADSNATINTGTASFTLQDDDGKSVASFSGTSQFEDEDAGTITIPITLNKVSGFDTDITYSIINTGDANAANDPCGL